MGKNNVFPHRLRISIIVMLCFVSAGRLHAESPQQVDVIVNPSLYAGGGITASLNQYLADLRTQGYAPTLVTSGFATPADLRGYLAERDASVALAGAVLVGDLPVAHFERRGQFGNAADYQRFASDLYYQDLSGAWGDADGNGTLDTHSGAVAPDIWMGRLTTSTLVSLHAGRSEAGLLNQYFQKNHDYRTGVLRASAAGLAYVDDDWRAYAPMWSQDISQSLAGRVTNVSSVGATTAADYRDRLQTAYESVLLGAHSTATWSGFKTGGSDFSGGGLSSYELEAVAPQALFYNLFACSGAAFETEGYMAGEYVFGAGQGLLAVGSTKTGSMMDFWRYYASLGDGRTFGEAMMDWWGNELPGGPPSSYAMDWFYGMTLIGDPTLLTQDNIPEPICALLLLTGLAWLTRRRKLTGNLILAAGTRLWTRGRGVCHFSTSAAARMKSETPLNPPARERLSSSAFSEAVSRMLTCSVRSPDLAGTGGRSPSSSIVATVKTSPARTEVTQAAGVFPSP